MVFICKVLACMHILFYFEPFLYYRVLSASFSSSQAVITGVIYTSFALFFPITELHVCDYQVLWYLMANACTLDPCQCTPGPTYICHPCNWGLGTSFLLVGLLHLGFVLFRRSRYKVHQEATHSWLSIQGKDGRL